MQQIVITKSTKQTQEFAQKFTRTILSEADKDALNAQVLLLYGNLGVGKTSFMQGFAKGLGIKQRIISPTFLIMREYKARFKNLYHLDLYRITSEDDLEGLGIREIFQDKEAIVAIEWPEKLGSLMPKKRWEIYMSTISDNERKIEITNLSS